MAAKKMAMTVPALPAPVRIACAGVAPAARAVIAAANATLTAPDSASSRVRICVVCMGPKEPVQRPVQKGSAPDWMAMPRRRREAPYARFKVSSGRLDTFRYRELGR
jgi:hypothetical protein